MNSYKLSHTLSTFEPLISAKDSMVLLKQPMIETPLKDRRFDPNELMTIDLIKTPLDNEALINSSIGLLKDDFRLFQASSQSNCDHSIPSMIANLSVRNRMVCHEDFPRLLALLNKIKKAKATTKNLIKQSAEDESEAIATLMKEKLGVNNFTISRGQCPLTDRMMQGYYTMLQHSVNDKTTVTTGAAHKMHSISPTRLLHSQEELTIDNSSISMQSIQNNDLTNSDLISWAEAFLKISPLVGSKPPTREKKSIKRKKTFQNKKSKDKKAKDIEMKSCDRRRNAAIFMDNGVPPMVSHTKKTREKKLYAEISFDSSSLKNKNLKMNSVDAVMVSSNLRFGENSPVKQSLVQPKPELSNSFARKCSSLSSPMQTIDSDIAIALTPHPFKKPRTDYLPPSEVTMKNFEPLSDITPRNIRNSIAFTRNSLGVPVGIPRVSLFLDDARTTPSSDGSKITNIFTAKESRDHSIEKPSLQTADEKGTSMNGSFCAIGESMESFHWKNADTDRKCIKHSVFTETKSPRILSVSFQ